MSAMSELAHLFRALKAPAAARALPKLAERARAEDWSYERFAHALLSTEHASREAHGDEGRPLPGQKTLEEFDYLPALGPPAGDRAPRPARLPARALQHRGLGPPGTGETHLPLH
jgi:DNA replication protein DnaC